MSGVISTRKHGAFDVRDASTAIDEGFSGNLYLDGLAVLVTANRNDRLGQCAGSRLDVSGETLPVARMLRRWDDQFNRMSDGLTFGKSE